MTTVQTTNTNLSVPDADGGAVNLTVPQGARGPVALTMQDSSLNLRVQLLEQNGSVVAPAPNSIQGTNQIVIFEAGEVVGLDHGYSVWHDGAGAQPAILESRARV